jgi:hypothetical protein
MTVQDPVAVLERWVLLGAQWRVAELSEERAVVDLCACTGETVDHLESADPALIAYLRTVGATSAAIEN